MFSVSRPPVPDTGLALVFGGSFISLSSKLLDFLSFAFLHERISRNAGFAPCDFAHCWRCVSFALSSTLFCSLSRGLQARRSLPRLRPRETVSQAGVRRGMCLSCSGYGFFHVKLLSPTLLSCFSTWPWGSVARTCLSRGSQAGPFCPREAWGSGWPPLPWLPSCFSRRVSRSRCFSVA